MRYRFLAVGLIGVMGSGCGPGSDMVSHTGVCGNYPAQSTSLYKLPYAASTSHEVGQGNCSGVSHYGDSRYAYDISMDIGTSIVAARAGTVIALEESNENGNGCPSANYVKVQHSDGTVAIYAHLTKDGVDVNLNAAVTQGQALGKSGNTGCSTGPHLHFHVTKTSSSNQTVPITFSNTASHPGGLQAGNSYLAN